MWAPLPLSLDVSAFRAMRCRGCRGVPKSVANFRAIPIDRFLTIAQFAVMQEIARDYTGWASGARRQARAGALSDSELMQRDPGLAKPGSANSAVSQSPGNMSDWT